MRRFLAEVDAVTWALVVGIGLLLCVVLWLEG
jgi:hypothetical protein